MDFDLRQLRHARALAEEGSFARAARTLHLTQPALSRSIQELERRTGIRLFDRAQAGVELTDLGRAFMVQARELLGRAEALDREITTMRGSGTGRLAIGSGTFPSALFMPAALAGFLQRNPGVTIRVVNDNWVSLVAALRRRELEFVVAAPPAREEAPDLSIRLLSPWQARFLAWPGHPLFARTRVSIDDVAAYPLVCTSRLSGPIVEILLAARKGSDNVRPVPDVACESHEVMRQVAAQTDHVLISTLAGNAAAIAAGELSALPVDDPRLVVRFAILRLESRTLRPIADELMDAVEAADVEAVATERALVARARATSPRPPAPRAGRRRQLLDAQPR
jgi:DNA-binding transcriptional LysR family regulator